MMRISLCNEVVAGLPFAEQAKLAAALGYDGLEVAPFTLDGDAPHRIPAARRAELRRIAADNIQCFFDGAGTGDAKAG